MGTNLAHPLVRNPPVKQVIEPTTYGQRCVAVGKANEGKKSVMEIHYILPLFTYPPRFIGEDGMWHAFVPRDDYGTWSWDVQFSLKGPINAEAQHARRGLQLDESLRKKKNITNMYEQDRRLMGTRNFSGIRGIANQDHALTEKMGPMVDRSKEHLGTSDIPIIGLKDFVRCCAGSQGWRRTYLVQIVQRDRTSTQ